MPAGFHLPSDVSDFGKGHTLDLAYIMEERRHELAYLHREQQFALAAAAAGPGQGSIQPMITPGELPPQQSVTSQLAEGLVRVMVLHPWCSLQFVANSCARQASTSWRQGLPAVCIRCLYVVEGNIPDP